MTLNGYIAFLAIVPCILMPAMGGFLILASLKEDLQSPEILLCMLFAFALGIAICVFCLTNRPSAQEFSETQEYSLVENRELSALEWSKIIDGRDVICLECGEINSKDSVFCQECDAWFGTKCPNCGAEIDGNYCSKCGLDLYFGS